MRHFRRFLVFFVLYVAMVTLIQLYIFPSDEALNVIIVKNVFSGVIAGAIFVFLIRKK